MKGKSNFGMRGLQSPRIVPKTKAMTRVVEQNSLKYGRVDEFSSHVDDRLMIIVWILEPSCDVHSIRQINHRI